jgi:hypothetical protein
MNKVSLIVLGLAFIIAALYGVVVTIDKNALESELSSVRNTLTSTRADLGSTKQSLASTRADLSSTRQQLISTSLDLTSTRLTLDALKLDLASTQQILDSTKLELTSVNQQLSSVRQSSASLQNTLSAAQKQLTVAQDTLTGLGISISSSKECYDVELIDNPSATNPSLARLLAFLSDDQTDKHTYVAGVYDCSQFSRDIHNNAESAGIRTAEVQLQFKNEKVGHALNAFITTDYGLIYVDCTGSPDTFARVETGKVYRSIEVNKVKGSNVRNDSWWDALDTYYYLRSSTGGENITSVIKIYW